MRKIDKTAILSKVYKNWEESLNEHPTYDSSDNKFYYDVVMNLFHCQNGLCAYTEKSLCNPKYIDSSFWQDDKYPYSKEKSLFNGSLDHFDSTKKKSQSWLWDNLFMVDSDTNRRKGTKEVDEILKPDRADYDPFKLLEYDIKTHSFIANTELPEEAQIKINHLLDDVLGVNHSSVCFERRRILVTINSVIDGPFTWETVEITEFPTAFEFCKREILKQS
jgi:hypothetical protein